VNIVRMLLKKTEPSIFCAIGAAFLLHIFFFLLFEAAPQEYRQEYIQPPSTAGLFAPASSAGKVGNDARLIWSPALFSFPSKMGFSRELLQEKPRTRLLSEERREPESFLAAGNETIMEGNAVSAEELLLSSTGPFVPPLPASPVESAVYAPAFRRVYMEPELKARLRGGIELPASLNKTGATAWQVRADIMVDKEGTVEHVFLEAPLKSAEMNQAVLQTLYHLKFSPAQQPVCGRIEIYSSEPAAEKKGVKK